MSTNAVHESILNKFWNYVEENNITNPHVCSKDELMMGVIKTSPMLRLFQSTMAIRYLGFIDATASLVLCRSNNSKVATTPGKRFIMFQHWRFVGVEGVVGGHVSFVKR